VRDLLTALPHCRRRAVFPTLQTPFPKYRYNDFALWQSLDSVLPWLRIVPFFSGRKSPLMLRDYIPTPTTVAAIDIRDRANGGDAATFSFDVYDPLTGLPGDDRIDEAISGIVCAMPNHRVGDYFSYKRSMFASSDYVVISHDSTGTVAAVLVAKWYRTALAERFFNLETLLISERFHRTALSRQSLAALFRREVAIDREFPDHVTLKTYTPRSYNMMNVFARNDMSENRMYPRIDGEGQDEELMALAGRMADVLSPGLEFDRQHGVIRGGAGQVPDDFWPSFPKTRRNDINTFFSAHLSPRDRMLCLLAARSEGGKQQVLSMLRV
jgi:hypothetical protein